MTKERWLYFLTDCLKTDDRVLYKLLEDKPRARWIETVREFALGALAAKEVQDRTVRQLAAEAEAGRGNLVQNLATKLITKLGYETKTT